jgi:hypothetical protein
MIPVHVNCQIPHTSSGGERGIVGEVRAINGALQVYTGTQFIPIHISAFVDNIELGTLVEWAKQKMEEEAKLDELNKRFPAFNTAKENYELMKAMVRNEVA